MKHLKYGVDNEGNEGHGIELELGYLAQQEIKGNVFIIKSAVGGTTLGDLDGTTTDWSDKGTLFPALDTKFNKAIYNLDKNNVSYTVKGFWWDQGENDAISADHSNEYQTNLNALETRIRSQFTDGDNLEYFVTVRLSSNITLSYLNAVRDAEETKTYIDTDDPDLQSDYLHLTSESQNILAERFFNLVY